MKSIFTFASFAIFSLSFTASAQSVSNIPFPCKPLTATGDLSSIMVEGIDSFLTRETYRARTAREGQWHRDFSSADAFNELVAHQRELLSAELGVVDHRVKPALELLSNDSQALHVETAHCIIRPVRWQVLENLYAEGLLLQPKTSVRARIVLIPDADILPETMAGLQHAGQPCFDVARRLAEAGAEVLVPVLVSRDDSLSGNPSLGLFTNMPHREWLYRQAYEVGRHVIGYELQKILSAIDWFASRGGPSNIPVGVGGYGEGGLLAMYAAALDTRISATLVSGYFNERDNLWKEPIYHNVFGVLQTFGDAELAVMSWPRPLIIEHSSGPVLSGPPPPSKGRSGAAPGALTSPGIVQAKTEFDKAIAILPAGHGHLDWYANGKTAFDKPFSSPALQAFVGHLQIHVPTKAPGPIPVSKSRYSWVDAQPRQQRAVRGMEANIQKEVIVSERNRDKHFWAGLQGDTAAQRSQKTTLRQQFWQQIGRLPDPSVPANTKARLLQKTDKWTSYEVTLDVWPGVFAWGILLVPNDLKPGEHRPVVVCQHGLEGVPSDVVTTDSTAENYHFYKGFASRLAERGYVIFAPCNLYRGKDKFRVLQRKANPLGLTLFSVMIGQHQRIVDWLGQLSFVDAKHIGFYGLSYGGKSAMRIPAVVEGYCLSICSADFNEWIRKSASTDYPFSYVFNGEYDMQEWNLGNTFSYAEMAGLIAPRPFMVERGHFDQVGTDEWVGYEFAKVRRHYDLLGLPDHTRIEYFAGPHTIHGVGTFEFLDRFLKNAR